MAEAPSTNDQAREPLSVTVGGAVTPTEAARLDALASARGLTRSSALRAALAAGLAELEGGTATSAPPSLSQGEALATALLAVLERLDRQEALFKKGLERVYQSVEQLHEKAKR